MCPYDMTRSLVHRQAGELTQRGTEFVTMVPQHFRGTQCVTTLKPVPQGPEMKPVQTCEYTFQNSPVYNKYHILDRMRAPTALF